MRDAASVLTFPINGDGDWLLRRVRTVIEDIERMKEERNAEATRAALLHVQAVHAAKRLRKLVDRS